MHHTAFTADNVEIADVLVKAGADLWLLDHENKYPLHVAERHQRVNLFQYFAKQMLLQKPNWKCPITFLDHDDHKCDWNVNVFK